MVLWLNYFKTNTIICSYVPLNSYIGYRRKCGASECVSLFVCSNGYPLYRSSFINKLKTSLSHLELDSNRYSEHSFRKGAATTCSSNFVQYNMIKALGRWKSDCYTKYIRTSYEDITEALRQMCN